MHADEAASVGIEYFCPTCNLIVPADKVQHGTLAMVHLMRVPATCASCPARQIPHIVTVRRKAED